MLFIMKHEVMTHYTKYVTQVMTPPKIIINIKKNTVQTI